LPSEVYGILHGVDLLFDKNKAMPPFVPTSAGDQLVMYENLIQEPYHIHHYSQPNSMNGDNINAPQRIYRHNSLTQSSSHPHLIQFKKDNTFVKCNSFTEIFDDKL
jgi:hypothetical protein